MRSVRPAPDRPRAGWGLHGAVAGAGSAHSCGCHLHEATSRPAWTWRRRPRHAGPSFW